MSDPVIVSAFRWVPDFAQGFVRDFRVRWALEEAGEAYATNRLDATSARPPAYLEEQPWGQVPAYREDKLAMFESGAIVLHIGERCPALLPTDPNGRARAQSWAFAALNSVEPAVAQLSEIDIFHKGEAWTVERRPQVIDKIRARLDGLAARLGDRDYLEGSFTAGDLLMIDVLRSLENSGVLADYPSLSAYKDRGKARPAFARAMAAQMADFEQMAAA